MREAVSAGAVKERHFSDVKREIQPGEKANRALAVDLAEYGGLEWELWARFVVAVGRAVTWVPRQFLAAARADLRRGRLSSATLGFGTGLVCAVTAPIGFAAGGAVVNVWSNLLLVSVALGLAYPLLHTGDAVRASLRPDERAQNVGRRLAASIGVFVVDLSFVGGALNASDSAGINAGLISIASLVAIQLGAFFWGLFGRPDPIRLLRR